MGTMCCWRALLSAQLSEQLGAAACSDYRCIVLFGFFWNILTNLAQPFFGCTEADFSHWDAFFLFRKRMVCVTKNDRTCIFRLLHVRNILVRTVMRGWTARAREHARIRDTFLTRMTSGTALQK